MKYQIIIISFIILSFSATGQIIMHGLSSNPVLITKSQTTYSRNINTIDTLSLPFIDDFAYDSLYPSQQLWLDRDVFINNNFANHPPSIGVATFDVLDQSGFMYDTAGVNALPCDYLTSKPINLSEITAADSLYFSFYYQPQGNGWDQPEKFDSLVLQFKTSTKDWLSIHSIAGSALKAFEQIMIPIIDTSYFKKSFQFRFFNYASIGGNQNQEDAISNDFWNLDYIVLDTARSINSPYHNDLTTTHFNSSLFVDYYSVPWTHYNLNKMPLDSISLNYMNLKNETNNINRITYLLYQDNTVLKDSFDLGGTDINANSTWGNKITQQGMVDQDENATSYNIPTSLYDSTQLTVHRYYKAETNIDPRYYFNDTSKFTQNFYNYYAFDDGTAESAISLVQSESRFAFKINGLKADTLRGVSMFFNRYKDYGTADEAVFTLCIWENNNGIPGDTIYTENSHTPKYGYSNNYFSTYKLKKGIFVEDTFFIGWINETDKVYSLGFDLNTNDKDRVFTSLANYDWESYKNGVPMMRPILGDDFVENSITEIAKTKQVKIFPNPSSGLVQIQFDSNSEMTIQIYNSIGVLVLNKTIKSNDIIDLSQYNKGLFILRTEGTTHKIIVQ